jgi:oligopeptide/dipeptide ABC transporter ATP-binding protein
MSDPVPLLEVRDLRTEFATDAGTVRAVDGVSFSIAEGETVGIVGESGSGKSVTARSIMRLLDEGARIAGGTISFRGRDVMHLDREGLRALRGSDIAMVFQDPMTSLNPVRRIAGQLVEGMTVHGRYGKGAARARAIDLLRRMGVSAPERALDSYPHEFSGGMRQRVMLAMGFSNGPSLLIADEPTTALDVTIQAQILELIVELQREFSAAVLLITHDLGVVAETAHRVIVMYAGRKVEEATVGELFAKPLHPYTVGLMNSIPRLDLMRGQTDRSNERLQEIPGIVPPLFDLPPGCAFAPRCGRADEKCRSERPAYEEKQPGHWAACWHTHG